MNNHRLIRVLFITTGLLSLFSAGYGVINPAMYEPVVPDRIMPGVFTQDLFVLASSLILIILSVIMRPNGIRKMIVNSGILGFLFYAYGIYVIEQLYTPLYPVYLAILSLSFFTLITAFSNLEKPFVESLQLPSWIRYLSAAYGLFIAVIFNIIWFSHLIPLLQTANRIEYMFSVYIIDLVFIMPAFMVTAVLLLRNHPIGIIGIPALFILGVGILGPLSVAELLKPIYYGLQSDPGELQLFGLLTLSFLILTIVYLTALKSSTSVVSG